MNRNTVLAVAAALLALAMLAAVLVAASGTTAPHAPPTIRPSGVATNQVR